MSRFTPPLKAKGLFTLVSPFPDISNKVYQCVAIRSFKDYEDLGESPLETVYTPNSLTSTEYDADRAEGACIVTLVSETDATIQVPDTYIARYPDLEYVPYHTLVLSAMLGPMPDEVSLDLLKNSIAGVISDVIGVMPTVNVHVTGAQNAVSIAQHNINELSREAAISNRLTDRAKLLAANETIIQLQGRISALEDAILNSP